MCRAKVKYEREALAAFPGQSSRPEFKYNSRAGETERAETGNLRSLTHMNRTSLTILLAVSMAATVGCTSKNYVKQQTTPLINKTNELDDMTAKNSKDIKEVDARAQAGIQAVNVKTADVEQKAQAAGQSASAAQQMADTANSRVGVLTNTVANLDNYRPVAETSVKFGFNRDNLTEKSKEALDQLAGSIASTKGYIIALEGSTDSVGSADYNYDLSQRRANAVIQYLASKYNVPAHKIYVIGLGKDKPLETNKTREGRADNRRVDVRLMTNTVGDTTPSTTPTTTGQNNPSSL
jgi:outer membrane protein OmpA-like peptidoglycan-associated protein